jgi:LAO/AO transport system kinase
VVKTVAVTGEGMDDLVRAVADHGAWLRSSGEGRRREAGRARSLFLALLKERLVEGALSRLEAETGHLDEVAAAIALRRSDPWALAEELAGRLAR